MLYRKITSFIEQFYSQTQQALLITGARQTGKTYSIREFGKRFANFVEINFIEQPRSAEIIRGASSAEDILFRLSVIAGHQLVAGETLIFFDEVQECREIVSAIKFLVDEGSYRYILSGSLLGVKLNDLRSEPVGYMDIKEMFPLDIEEFFLNLGVNSTVIGHLRQHWESLEPVDEAINQKFLELFRLYLIVGGMPAAVAAYLNDNDLQSVLTVQQSILALYRRDISKYANASKLNIKEIFDLIPSELNSKNKRFILKALNEHAKFNRYKDDFLWLKDAGVAIPVYNVEEPKEPLRLAELRNLFKLFSNDVGLLCAQYANGLQLRILAGDNALNIGAVYENAVAQELTAQGFAPYYYNNKHRGEVDFLVSRGFQVLPIEVKSGKDYDVHRALANILEVKEFQLSEALVFANCNLRREGAIKYAPIYMVMFVAPEKKPLGKYRIDLSGLQ